MLPTAWRPFGGEDRTQVVANREPGSRFYCRSGWHRLWLLRFAMSTYAVGDVQGCCAELQQLLRLIGFDPGTDRLLLVGDLVNRGPASLETLRLVRSLGSSAITVLGNHDLHLLAVAAGVARPGKGDTLEQILAAPDRDSLLGWLRSRPLLHRENGCVVVHAGLLPQWSMEDAQRLAGEVEFQLRSANSADLLGNLYGNQPDRWDERLTGAERWRVIVNAMTRMRFVSRAGVMEFASKGEADDPPPGHVPWFELPGRWRDDGLVICGHWSALGLRIADGLAALDTGCVWGGRLTALRLEDRQVFQVPALRPAAVHPR